MIAKAVKGASFKGAVSYDLAPEKGALLDTNMAGETPAELAAEFEGDPGSAARRHQSRLTRLPLCRARRTAQRRAMARHRAAVQGRDGLGPQPIRPHPAHRHRA